MDNCSFSDDSISRRGRKVINLSTKKAIIEFDGTGLSHRKIADKFGLARSTVTKILLNKQSILKNDLNGLNNSWSRIHDNDINKLELELAKWCIDDKNSVTNIDQNYLKIDNIKKELPIKIRDGLNDKIILSKARELCYKMELFDLNIRRSWLSKFKAKFNLNFEIGSKKRKNSLKDKEKNVNDTNYIENNKIDEHPPFHIVKSNIPYDLQPSALSNLLNSSLCTNQTENLNTTFEMNSTYSNLNFFNNTNSQHLSGLTPLSASNGYDNNNNNYANSQLNSRIDYFKMNFEYF